MTIMIDDVNDHSPRFVQSVYSATMSESLPRGASIISVSATDQDIGSNAKLIYTLREQDREHFYISSVEATNTGVLKVFKVTGLPRWRHGGIFISHRKVIAIVKRWL